MDLDGVAYQSFDDLVPYCRRVAGSIGRLSLAVFRTGERPVTAELDALADDLGVALQLTNILRDVREDYGHGRIYLPLDDLARCGVEPRELGGGPSPRRAPWCASKRGALESGSTAACALTASLDRRSAACVGAMAGIYARLLVRIEREPEQVFRGRLSLPPYEKVWVALRALVGATP